MAKRHNLLLFTFACLFITSHPFVAWADDFDQQIEKASQSIQSIQSERSSVARYKEAMEKQISDLQAESAVLLNDKTEKEAEANKLSQKIAELTKVIEKRQVILEEQARSIQIGQTSSTLLETVLNSDSISAAIGNVYAAATIITASKSIVTDQKADVEKNKKLTEQLETELKAIDKQTQLLIQKQADLADLKVNQEVRLADLAIELNQQEGKKEQLKQQKAQAEKERAEMLARIEKERQEEEQARKAVVEAMKKQAEQAQAAAEKAAQVTQKDVEQQASNSQAPATQAPTVVEQPTVSSPPPVTTSSGWTLPIDSVHISSGFGSRPDPTGISGTFHNGIDFTGPRGTPVYSIGSGKVVEAGYESMAGNYVIILHDNGYYSYYFHMNSAPAVSVGQAVGGHQYIGAMGTTGNSTGVHLHLSISKGPRWRNFINPAQFFAL